MKDSSRLLEALIALLPEDTKARLPSPRQILLASEEALADQISDYGRVLLPRLGIGQHVESPARTFQFPSHAYTHRPFSYWHFDARGEANWLHAALLYPFEHLDNWVVLVSAADLDPWHISQLRPPMIPRLQRTLKALEWIVVDQGGHEGGRLERHEFLDILGDKPWLRVEHSTHQGVFIIQRWFGKELLERWSARVDETFSTPYAPPSTMLPSSASTTPARDWQPDPQEHPIETLITLDVLCDPYATLRRFVQQRWGFDIDRIGPGLLWRDSPDELFEFDEDEDDILADMSHVIADRLDADPAILTPLIDQWFEVLFTSTPAPLPTLGTLIKVEIPALEVEMKPPSRHRNPEKEKFIIEGETLFAATPQSPTRDASRVWKKQVL